MDGLKLAPKATIIPKPKTPQGKAMWWERTIPHPMTDKQFVKAFCEYVFETTTDVSINIIRNRVFHFITNFMNPELANELEAYRKVHPDA